MPRLPAENQVSAFTHAPEVDVGPEALPPEAQGISFLFRDPGLGGVSCTLSSSKQALPGYAWGIWRPWSSELLPVEDKEKGTSLGRVQ